MRERGLELKVGGLIVVAAAILIAFVIILGNFSVGSGYRLYVDFDYTGSLQPGAAVKVSGIKVGRVEDVEFWGGRLDEAAGRRVQVRAELWVEDRVKEAIRQDAEFFINTAGVLGEQYVEIAPGSHEKPALAPDSVVRGVDPPRTDLIVARLYDFLDAVTDILHEDKDVIRDLLRNGASAVKELNVLLVENRESLRKLIAATGDLADEGALVLSTVRKGVDPATLNRTMKNLESTLGGASRALDELVPKVSRFTDEGTRVAGLLTEERVERAFAAADSASKVLDRSVDLVDSANGMLQDIRDGKGTAGKLLTREELYADLKEMIRDLKRNPWKFFWKE